MTNISSNTTEQLTTQTASTLLELARSIQIESQPETKIAGFQIDFPRNIYLTPFILTLLTQEHCFAIIERPNNDLIILTMTPSRYPGLFDYLYYEINGRNLHGSPLTPSHSIAETYSGVSTGSVKNINIETLLSLAKAYQSLLLKEQFIPVAIGILPKLQIITSLINRRLEIEFAKD